MKEIKINEIKGFKIGHAQNTEGATGCTAIICEQGAWAGVDVRGGSPASRETELLRPVNTVEQIHCVMLSGGSAFGLEAGDGAMQYLEEHGVGFDVGIGRVPIVCGASLFDLELVDFNCRPDKAMGYAACKNAELNDPGEGNVGAGTGATVGKFHNMDDYMKSGLGIYAAQVGAVQAGAVVAVNALGDIIDYDTKKILAGLLNKEKTGFADTVKVMYDEIENARDLWSGNTTIGCVITNAKLTKSQCNKLASIAHNGYAQAIRPVHSTADGDTIFVMSTGEVEVGVDALGALVTECMARAINRAALTSEPAYGLPAARSFL
ncbi:MAG: P1 family peptidase [Candidatus Heteroscillospira sp.]|jgi:L-aminopeptidase/D-esterase-like protein